jgi:cell division transport system permease protein
VVVWLCPDGTSQAASCASGAAPTQAEIVDIEHLIHTELGDVVSKIAYQSREDFYNNTFLKQYPDGIYEGRTLTAANMQDSLKLKLTNPTKYQVVSEVLTGRTGVEEVVDQRQIFDPVFNVLNKATIVTVVLAAVMVVVAVMLTGTTIRMSAASRKNETEIMRLVGASNWTIRLPFILEGVVASLIGSLLASGALSAIVKVFITDGLAKNVQWMPYIDQKTVWLMAPILILGAMALAAIASAVSLRRYLKA